MAGGAALVYDFSAANRCIPQIHTDLFFFINTDLINSIISVFVKVFYQWLSVDVVLIAVRKHA